MAPTEDRASCTPKAQPLPVLLAAWEIMASRAGALMALPMRSIMISRATMYQSPVKASSGMARRFMLYPMSTMVQ